MTFRDMEEEINKDSQLTFGPPNPTPPMDVSSFGDDIMETNHRDTQQSIGSMRASAIRDDTMNFSRPESPSELPKLSSAEIVSRLGKAGVARIRPKDSTAGNQGENDALPQWQLEFKEGPEPWRKRMPYLEEEAKKRAQEQLRSLQGGKKDVVNAQASQQISGRAKPYANMMSKTPKAMEPKENRERLKRAKAQADKSTTPAAKKQAKKPTAKPTNETKKKAMTEVDSFEEESGTDVDHDEEEPDEDSDLSVRPPKKKQAVQRKNKKAAVKMRTQDLDKQYHISKSFLNTSAVKMPEGTKEMLKNHEEEGVDNLFTSDAEEVFMDADEIIQAAGSSSRNAPRKRIRKRLTGAQIILEAEALGARYYREGDTKLTQEETLLFGLRKPSMKERFLKAPYVWNSTGRLTKYARETVLMAKDKDNNWRWPMDLVRPWLDNADPEHQRAREILPSMLGSKGVRKRKAPIFKKSQGKRGRFVRPEDTEEGRQLASASKATLIYNTLLEKEGDKTMERMREERTKLEQAIMDHAKEQKANNDAQEIMRKAWHQSNQETLTTLNRAFELLGMKQKSVDALTEEVRQNGETIMNLRTQVAALQATILNRGRQGQRGHSNPPPEKRAIT